VADLPLQGSMSAYYHSGDGAMRDVFVGLLFTVGALLGLYKGFTTLEDQALNLAGVLIALVALVPMEWDCGDACTRVSWHGAFAISFFLCIAYVAIFRASDILSLIPDAARANRYKKAYRRIGWAMAISPIAAALLSYLLQPDSEARSTIFFVELAGVLAFSAYWWVKSREIAQSNAERTAAEGKLTVRQYRAADLFRHIPVEYRENC
jgi:hypothetical protein